MHVGAVFWIFPQCMVAGLLGTPNAGRNLFLSNVFAHFRKILMQIMKIKQFLGLIPKSWLTQITWSSTLENWQKHAFCENWQKHAFCIYVWIFWKWNFFKVMKNIFLPETASFPHCFWLTKLEMMLVSSRVNEKLLKMSLVSVQC